MFSRPLAFLLLALACITAAAGGAYVATRRTAPDVSVASGTAAPAPAAASTKAASASQPVTETEAPVSTGKAAPAVEAAPKAETPAAPTRRAESASKKPATSARTAHSAVPAGRPAPSNGNATAVQTQPQPAPVAAPTAPEPVAPVDPPPPPPREPQFEELVLPAAAVIGLQLDTPVSSDRSRVEDRVDAHVTRDVMASGRVAIPSGSRVVGSVIAVEQGGKVSQPARLAIRFHTLILADGTEVSLRTEPIDRRSESPANSSTKKIGGAAVAGTILGAIIGGGKGAAAGGAIGAGAGTAAVMAGDRAAVTMPAGALLNARLSSPATITVERRDQ
jgi:type IV secretory pathway VirB10-like protein